MEYADIFIDTNLFLYAYDQREPEKQKRAREYLKPYFQQDKAAVISVQVLQEFSHQLLRRGFTTQNIRKAVQPLLYWKIINGTTQLYTHALEIVDQYHISLWDALIIAAAHKAEVKKLLTEDLNAGQSYEGVVVVNPFDHF